MDGLALRVQQAARNGHQRGAPQSKLKPSVEFTSGPGPFCFIVSARGAVVTNIAHIPAALTAVMRENGTRPDFASEGSLALKPWFGANQGLTLPREIDLAERDVFEFGGSRCDRIVAAVLSRL